MVVLAEDVEHKAVHYNKHDDMLYRREDGDMLSPGETAAVHYNKHIDVLYRKSIASVPHRRCDLLPV